MSVADAKTIAIHFCLSFQNARNNRKEWRKKNPVSRFSFVRYDLIIQIIWSVAKTQTLLQSCNFYVFIQNESPFRLSRCFICNKFTIMHRMFCCMIETETDSLLTYTIHNNCQINNINSIEFHVSLRTNMKTANTNWPTIDCNRNLKILFYFSDAWNYFFIYFGDTHACMHTQTQYRINEYNLLSGTCTHIFDVFVTSCLKYIFCSMANCQKWQLVTSSLATGGDCVCVCCATVHVQYWPYIYGRIQNYSIFIFVMHSFSEFTESMIFIQFEFIDQEYLPTMRNDCIQMFCLFYY